MRRTSDTRRVRISMTPPPRREGAPSGPFPSAQFHQRLDPSQAHAPAASILLKRAMASSQKTRSCISASRLPIQK